MDKRKIKVYLDTSVISALFDKKNPERQFLTQQFFKNVDAFDTYVSEVVLAEINKTRNIRLRTKLRKVAISFKILSVERRVEDWQKIMLNTEPYRLITPKMQCTSPSQQ
jgi:predicted nucleic acid-binding protein